MPIRGEHVMAKPIMVDLDYKGVTGRVGLLFQDGASCTVVTGPDYATRDDRVQFRGREYHIRVFVNRLSEDGELIVWGIDSARNSYQSVDAPPSFKDKIIQACIAAVQEYGTQEVIERATYRRAMDDLARADLKADELQSQLSEARGEQVRLRAIASRYAPRTAPV